MDHQDCRQLYDLPLSQYFEFKLFINQIEKVSNVLRIIDPGPMLKSPGTLIREFGAFFNYARLFGKEPLNVLDVC